MVATNLSNYHQQLLGNHHPMATQFSSIFKPISTVDDHSGRGGLSLWMAANNDDLINLQHHLPPVHPGSTIYGHDQFVHTATNPPPPSDNYQLINWVFDQNKVAPTSNAPETTSHHHQELITSVPSLFSNQLHHRPHDQQAATASANMSATALLQKAAQIGVTSTETGPFLGSFGLKSSCGSNSSSNLGNSNVDQVHDGSKYSGLFGSNNSDNLLDSSSPAANDISSLAQMYPTAKRRRTTMNVNDQEVSGGQTRDFLGVGSVHATMCHPSSINGWI